MSGCYSTVEFIWVLGVSSRLPNEMNGWGFFLFFEYQFFNFKLHDLMHFFLSDQKVEFATRVCRECSMFKCCSGVTDVQYAVWLDQVPVWGLA